MAYTRSPDGSVGVVDLDRGNSSSARKKQAEVVSESSYVDRQQERAGAQQMDTAVERMSLTRAAKDLNRAYPRPTVPDHLDPRKERALPGEIELRKQLSSRQAKARSMTKRSVFEAMPRTQHEATTRLISDPQEWSTTNAALSSVNGDAVQLDDRQRKQIQRVDRAIQSYERSSARGHVIYTEVTMPDSTALREQLPSTLKRGTVVAFDRFTMASHNLDELDSHQGPNDVALEIQTSRGMYLGRSDSAGGDTSHLLPRGVQFEVMGSHYAPYARTNGTVGERLVVQLRDNSRQAKEE